MCFSVRHEHTKRWEPLWSQSRNTQQETVVSFCTPEITHYEVMLALMNLTLPVHFLLNVHVYSCGWWFMLFPFIQSAGWQLWSFQTNRRIQVIDFLITKTWEKWSLKWTESFPISKEVDVKNASRVLFTSFQRFIGYTSTKLNEGEHNSKYANTYEKGSTNE